MSKTNSIRLCLILALLCVTASFVLSGIIASRVISFHATSSFFPVRPASNPYAENGWRSASIEKNLYFKNYLVYFPWQPATYRIGYNSCISQLIVNNTNIDLYSGKDPAVCPFGSKVLDLSPYLHPGINAIDIQLAYTPKAWFNLTLEFFPADPDQYIKNILGKILFNLSCLILLIGFLIYVSDIFRTTPQRLITSVTVVYFFLLTFMPATWEWRLWEEWVHKFIFAAGIFALATIIPRIPPFGYLFGQLGNCIKYISGLPEKLLVGFASLTFLAITYYLSGALFQHLPTIIDSMATYGGGKIFAQGKLYADSHPLREFFNVDWYVNDGKFYPFYPPGHILFMALGHLVGNPAICNPILGALSLITTYYISKELGGPVAGKISLVLFILSPFIVFMASEYMSHVSGMLMTLLFVLFYIKTVKYASWTSAIFAGMSFGYICITRPQVITGLAFVIACHALWTLTRNPSNYFWKYTVMAICAIPFLLFFGYYNWVTTGDALVTGYQKYFTNHNFMPGETYPNLIRFSQLWPLDIERAVWQTQELNRQLFGWPIPDLLLAFLPFLFLKQKKYAGLLAAIFFSTFVQLVMNPFGFVDHLGPRYLYEVCGVLIALSAISLSQLATRPPAKITHNAWNGTIFIVLCLLVAVSLNTKAKDLYKIYGSGAYHTANLPAYNKIQETTKKPALILIENRTLLTNLSFLQPPDDKADLIIGKDLGAEKNKEIIDYYKDRYVYIIRDPLHDPEIELITSPQP